MTFSPWIHHYYQCGRRAVIAFQLDHCLETAGSLAFSTLLAIVPMAIVLVWVLSGFEEITRLSLQAQEFILDNLVPDAAAGVRGYILELSQRSGKIPHYGLGFLIMTAMLLLYAVDSGINRIWKAETAHRPSLRAPIYFLILVLLPILLGLSLTITSFIASLSYINSGLSLLGVEYVLLAASPVMISTVMLTLLFKFSPRIPVSWADARIGALVAAILFEISKYVFSWYMIQFPNYEMVYGALSFLPIFMIWIYLSWCIVLFGAQISHACQVEGEK